MTLVLAAGIAAAADAGPKAPQETLDVAVLTPRDGIALNAASVDIQALVSARRAGRSDDDVWTGWMRVDLAIDGVISQTLDPTICRGQIAAGFRANLANLAAGPHTATITASKKTRGNTVRGSASLAFVIDRTLPVREPNRIEGAATPTPFACLSTPDFDPDDDDRADDYDGRYATLRGSFVTNALSAGIDLRRDRVILAIDDQVMAIEPGSFVCRNHDRCRFTDGTSPLVRSVRLEQKKNGRWTFTVATRHRPWPTRSLFLRIGANWGGLDYVHDRYVAALDLALDAAHRATATIGAAGGTVQTTDASGVAIQLSVPAGALTRDTTISATPLAAAPLVGQAPRLGFGVKFEPEGLVFAVPATVSLDFSAANTAPGDTDFIYLVTSPMTRVPLVDNGRSGTTLTASLRHFTTISADDLAPLFGNLVDWDPRFAETGALTFTELAQLAEALRVQLAMGCDAGAACAAVDAAYRDLVRMVDTSLHAIMPSCAGDVALPTRAAFNHWKILFGLAQGLELDSQPILDCARNVLNALVNKANTDGRAHPSDAAVTELNELEGLAQSSGFATIAANAHADKHDVLGLVIDQAGATATADPSPTSLSRMVELKARAASFGFADLDRRVLEKSVAPARTAISRLETACNANPTAPTTDVAKELARTWVTFVNLDPTVAPTLRADFQSAADQCGARPFGFIVKGDTQVGRPFCTAYATISGDEACVSYHEARLLVDSGLPVSMSGTSLTGSAQLTVSRLSQNAVAVDVARTEAVYIFLVAELTFPTRGVMRLSTDVSWGQNSETFWGLQFSNFSSGFFEGGCGTSDGVFYCVAGNWTYEDSVWIDHPIVTVQGTNSVDIPVEAGTIKMALGDGSSLGPQTGGRVLTITFIPSP